MNDGGPAFPNVETISGEIHSIGGMSLRDWFAGQALNGLLSQSPQGFWASYKAIWVALMNEANTESDFGCAVASLSYAIADAMLAARDEVKEGE